MKCAFPPTIDLDVLKKEVLDQEPAAALPCRLSDFWLERVAESLEQALGNSTNGSERYLAGPLALVVHLLFAQSQSRKFEISQTRLFECIQAYYVEISLEIVNRRTNISTTAATVETIFKHRLVTSTYDG